MIRHIVFFTVRKENHEAVRAGLSRLTGISHATKLEIGENLKRDQWGNEVDFIVYGEFETEADLAAFQQHPDYQFSTETVKPLREMRFAADFDRDQAVTRPLNTVTEPA